MRRSLWTQKWRLSVGISGMCWAGMIDGWKILHWFDIGATVTGQVYLDMLQKVVWPAFKYTASRRGYWFQQDSATLHTTVPVRAYLEE